ncbi:MAG: NADH-quinone oxidoreductase subunit C [Xanthomonadaceae bacterium]|nr:NADH-quinone oxidoreductase subunit C [Xanthomonadaceae bacterium]MDE2178980.1 NADH-quinone oxidoreductase subunit C [Xanthomonadaceae bacterium]MDE2245591.1 NADH-quinone oxidoreductase subunit C [Xanthomonadaceae bacterium]
MAPTTAAESPLATVLRDRLGDRVVALVEALGETTLVVAAPDLHAVATLLRDDPALRFGELMDLCGVDYQSYGEAEWETSQQVTATGYSRGVEGEGPGRFDWSQRPRNEPAPRRFAVVVHLLSVSHNRRLRLRCFCPDDGLPLVPSLTSLWPGANWFEREAFDLFGIIFDGHPDLRRILTDYGFVGHPFRKDFPLIGNVEVRYDPERQRVVYEPVSIEPRVGVARVIRHDASLAQARAEATDRWQQN